MADISINLIRRCKAREQEAFSLLFSRHDSFLYHLCYSYLGNKEDALDVIQEIYFKVFKNIDSFDEERSFLPWLKKIAVHTCLNYKRDMGKRQHLSLDFEDEMNGSFYEKFVAEEDVEEEVISLSMKEAIRSGLDLLPPAPRLILTLRYLEEMSCQEIAVTLEQPMGTVKNSLFRARNLLKAILLKQGLLEV
ncbi:MAG: RNA polymerase sigma factor [Dehalobacterium sp.]